MEEKFLKIDKEYSRFIYAWSIVKPQMVEDKDRMLNEKDLYGAATRDTVIIGIEKMVKECNTFREYLNLLKTHYKIELPAPEEETINPTEIVEEFLTGRYKELAQEFEELRQEIDTDNLITLNEAPRVEEVQEEEV
jgi:hypothetical protein